MKFEVYARKNSEGERQWYFRIRARNGEILAQSEGYWHRRDCRKAIRRIRCGALFARVKEILPVLP